jgi:uncharacterized protein YgbK (DUF1537 family)
VVTERQQVHVGVVADDLSGAADCGAAFRRFGLAVTIRINPRAADVGDSACPCDQDPVLVLVTDSRDQYPGEAEAAVARAVSVLASHRPRLWFKKIDSTLRGHLARELAVALDASGSALALVTPAFPAHGRTVVGGRAFLHGTPLEQTDVWGSRTSWPTADIPAILHAGGLQTRAISLADVRSGHLTRKLQETAEGTGIGVRKAAVPDREITAVVCDAETDDDLAAIADGGLASGLDLIWAGSAGLSRSLAAALAPQSGRAGRADRLPSVDGPVAVVVGSAAGAAAAQLHYLEAQPGLRVVRVFPTAALSGSAGELAAADHEITVALRDGQDVAVGFANADTRGETVVDAETSRAMSRALGRLIGRHSADIGGFVLTGGDTALAVLEACGVTTLRPADEVVTGVPVSVSYPGGRPAVTKAGAFGDDRILSQAISLLHQPDAYSERNTSHAHF